LSLTRLTNLWRQRLPLRSGPPPLKGLADNPAFQWWRDPMLIQPDSWWALVQSQQLVDARLDLMNELGAQAFRFDVPWREVAASVPGAGEYDSATAANPAWLGYRWARLDAIVDALDDAGIMPVPVVCFAPVWAAARDIESPASPPERPEYFADFMTALGLRYRGRVHHWELWNEPDHPHSWAGTMEEFVRLVLAPGARALRATAPECSVVLGGLADHRNLKTLHRLGAATHYDIASFHAYPPDATVRRVRGAVNEVRAVLRREGAGNRQVWVTECGLATAPPSPPSSFGGYTDEAGQARFVEALYSTVGADAIFFYQLSDTGIYNSAGEGIKQVHWGLFVDGEGRRKPGFDAFRRAAAGPADGRSRSVTRRKVAHPTHR
jgi:hypothetical protein